MKINDNVIKVITSKTKGRSHRELRTPSGQGRCSDGKIHLNSFKVLKVQGGRDSGGSVEVKPRAYGQLHLPLPHR